MKSVIIFMSVDKAMKDMGFETDVRQSKDNSAIVNFKNHFVIMSVDILREPGIVKCLRYNKKIAECSYNIREITVLVSDPELAHKIARFCCEG